MEIIKISFIIWLQGGKYRSSTQYCILQPTVKWSNEWKFIRTIQHLWARMLFRLCYKCNLRRNESREKKANISIAFIWRNKYCAQVWMRVVYYHGSWGLWNVRKYFFSIKRNRMRQFNEMFIFFRRMMVGVPETRCWICMRCVRVTGVKYLIRITIIMCNATKR